jgi:hypothetical protein
VERLAVPGGDAALDAARRQVRPLAPAARGEEEDGDAAGGEEVREDRARSGRTA